MTTITANYFSTHSTYAPRGMFSSIRRAFAVQAERRQLADMDDRMLADIGLSRSDAMTEARRPLWDMALRTAC